MRRGRVLVRGRAGIVVNGGGTDEGANAGAPCVARTRFHARGVSDLCERRRLPSVAWKSSRNEHKSSGCAPFLSITRTGDVNM